MQEYEPLVQIIDSVEAELQETNIDIDIAASTQDGNIDETMQIPHPGNYDSYDLDRPGVQRLYDIGTVMNNEAPVFIDSVQITQDFMREWEYKTIVQSLNEKQQGIL